MEIEESNASVNANGSVDDLSAIESQSCIEGPKKRLTNCCVPGCDTSSLEDYAFYAVQDIGRLQLRKWKKLLKLDRVKMTDEVCGKHFTKDQFSISHHQGRQYLGLKNDALPTAIKTMDKPKSASAIRRDIRMREKCGELETTDVEHEDLSPLTRTKLLVELDGENSEKNIKDADTTDLEKSNRLLHELIDRLKNFSFCQCTTCMDYYNRFMVHFDKEHQHDSNDEVPIDMVPADQVINEDFDYFDAFIEEDGSAADSEICEELDIQEVEVTVELETPAAQSNVRQTNLKEYHLSDIAQSDVVNTSKQVFFKVEKNGLDTLYACTVCNKRMVYDELAGHFKVHRSDNLTPAIVPKGLSRIDALYHRTEYQCVVCEELFLMRSLAHSCAQSHNPEDFPLHEQNEEHQSLIPSHEMDTAGEVEISQETELEERLGQIASESQQQPDQLPSQLGSVFNCHACDWVGTDINGHVKTVHGKKFRVLRADEAKLRYVIQCGALQCRNKNNQKLEFKTLQEAVAHRRTVHSKLVDYATTKNLTRILVHPDLTETVVDCDFLTFASNLLVRGFVCVCNCVFSQKEDAERCLAKHLGVKKYRCEYQVSNNTGNSMHRCKLMFYTAADLEQHHQKIHLNPNQAKVICEICGEVVLKVRLRRHAMSHRQKKDHREYTEGVQCPYCQKKYAGQYRLWKHIQVIHKQNKNFVCAICKTRFVHRTDAELCKAKHGKVKTQTCHLCNEKFYTKSEKSKHNFKYHNKNKLDTTPIDTVGMRY